MNVAPQLPAAPAPSARLILLRAYPDDQPKTDGDRELESLRLAGGVPVSTAAETRLELLVETVAVLREGASDVLIHFSAHGTEDRRLVFVKRSKIWRNSTEQQLADIEGLAELVATIGHLHGVVLSACHSAAQAEALVDKGNVPFAVGFTAAVSEDAANTFATAFYGHLSLGFSVAVSFEVAQKTLKAFPEHKRYAETVVLRIKGSAATASQLFFPPKPAAQAAGPRPAVPEITLKLTDKPVSEWLLASRSGDIAIACKNVTSTDRIRIWREGKPLPDVEATNATLPEHEGFWTKKLRLQIIRDDSPIGAAVHVALVPLTAMLPALGVVIGFVGGAVAFSTYTVGWIWGGSLEVSAIVLAVLSFLAPRFIGLVGRMFNNDVDTLLLDLVRPFRLVIVTWIFAAAILLYIVARGVTTANHTPVSLSFSKESIPSDVTRIGRGAFSGTPGTNTCTVVEHADAGDECIPLSEYPDAGVGWMGWLTYAKNQHVYCRRRWSVDGYSEDGGPHWLKARATDGGACDVVDETKPLVLDRLRDAGTEDRRARVWVAPDRKAPGYFLASDVRGTVAPWRSFPVVAGPGAARAELTWDVDPAGVVRSAAFVLDDKPSTILVPARSKFDLHLLDQGTLSLEQDCPTFTLLEVPNWLQRLKMNGRYTWERQVGAPAHALGLLCRSKERSSEGELRLREGSDDSFTIPVSALPNELSISEPGGKVVSTLQCEADVGAVTTVHLASYSGLPESCRRLEARTLRGRGFRSTSKAKGSNELKDAWFCWPDRYECSGRGPTCCGEDGPQPCPAGQDFERLCKEEWKHRPTEHPKYKACTNSCSVSQ